MPDTQAAVIHDRFTGVRDDLAIALSKASDYWPITRSYDWQFLLDWNTWESHVSTGEELRPKDVRDLAQAIEVLNAAGITVTLGRSAKGITYLNVNHEHFEELQPRWAEGDIEEGENE